MADKKISALTGATTPLAGTEILPIVQSSTTKQVSVANLTAGRTVSAGTLNLTAAASNLNQGTSGDATYFSRSISNTVSSTVTALTYSAGQYLDNAAAGDVVRIAPTGKNHRFGNSTTGATQVVIGDAGLTITAQNLIIGTSGKGIDFSDTPGTGTSELLADYEEGTWAPVIAAGVGSFTSYTSQGIYTKVGRIVTAWCSFQITNVGTGNTLCTINGYPFTSYNSAAPSQQAGVTLYRENNLTGATGYTTLGANSTSGALFATFANNYTFEFVMVYQTS